MVHLGIIPNVHPVILLEEILCNGQRLAVPAGFDHTDRLGVGGLFGHSVLFILPDYGRVVLFHH